jgi:hypothetical protein
MSDQSALRLGETIDAAGTRSGTPVMIEPGHLTTHGVIVGMTGSGKTGLGIVLLEEALSRGIPALILDPKGDMGNLLLNFPALRAEDFRPWIDEAEASRTSQSPDDLATSTAARWQKGLSDWGVATAEMRRLGMAARFTIFTPGSTAGVPIDVVGSLQAPAPGTAPEAVADEIEGFTSGLLALTGRSGDPLSSADHILISNLIARAWHAQQDLDLATLIMQIANPPIRKLGVFELDTFMPPKDRMALAVQLNALLASPSFAPWMRGVPLDMQRLLYDEMGRPRAAILYLAHLSEPERQFIVTLVMSRMVSWMRRQPGTSDLRALIYMDEVAGFAPPSAQPPSKKPILTILKQARAHGVGMVLSTQNPMDLDYMAMSNAGTWLIGRLQTERDKARILEGLRSATGNADIGSLDTHDQWPRRAAVPSAHVARRRAAPVHHALGDVVPARAAHAHRDRAVDERRSGPHRGTRRSGRRIGAVRRLRRPQGMTRSRTRRTSPRVCGCATSMPRRPGPPTSARGRARRCSRQPSPHGYT